MQQTKHYGFQVFDDRSRGFDDLAIRSERYSAICSWMESRRRHCAHNCIDLREVRLKRWSDITNYPCQSSSHVQLCPLFVIKRRDFFRRRVQAALAERVRYARKSAPHTILVARPAFLCNTKLRHIVDYSPAAIHRGQTPCYRNSFAWEYVNA